MSEELAAPEADGGTRRQVFVRCARRDRTWSPTASEVAAFFEACGKPKEILNKWGEAVPPDGRVREVVIVGFRKNKAVAKAAALSGGTLGGARAPLSR